MLPVVGILQGIGCPIILLSLARGYLAFAREHPNLWGAVFEHRLPAGENPPEWFLAKEGRLFGLVEAELKNAPALRTGETAQLAAWALWSGVHGIGILSLSNKLNQNDPHTPEQLVRSLVRGYLSGLAAAR